MTKGATFAVLARYSAGALGMRRAIEAIGGRDYADLVIAVAATDLAFPKPVRSARREADLMRARAILGPRLRLGG